MADKKIRRAFALARQGQVRLVLPLAGPPLPPREFSFTESQRSDLRRLAPRRLDGVEFASFVAEVEFQAAVHWAFKARIRLSPSAITSTLRAEAKRIAYARAALKRLGANQDIAGYMQYWVRQPFTDEEYRESVVNAGRLPAKGVPIHAKPGDSNFEDELRNALKTAQLQAEAEGRIPLRKISINELLSKADESLATIDEIVRRALAALEAAPRQGGRPRDIWRQGLIFRLADLYASFFKREPTATADNDFHQLVDVVFNALGWPQSDARRMILFALKHRKGAKT